MPDLSVKSILIRNWATIRECHLEFPEYGIVLVTGQNLTSHGKLKSVGSGKTTLGEALSRTLLGVPGRAANLSSYSRDGKGDTYVKVEAIARGHPLTVEMGYKTASMSKTGEALRFTSGETVERSHIDLTRAELASVIGIQPELSRWTIFVDGDALKFNRLSQKESVELVMSSLNQPPWSDYQENVRKVLLSLREEAQNAHHSLSEARQAIETAQTGLEQAETSLKAAKDEYTEAQSTARQKSAESLRKSEEWRKKASETTTGMDSIKKQIKSSEKLVAEELGEIEIARKKLRSQIAVADAEQEKALTSKTKAQTDQENAEEELNRLKETPKVCPTCKQKWPVDPAKEIDKAVQKERAAATRLASSEEILTEARAKRKALDDANDDHDGQQPWVSNHPWTMFLV